MGNKTSKFQLVIRDCRIEMEQNWFSTLKLTSHEGKITNAKGKVYEPITAPLVINDALFHPLLQLGMFSSARILFDSMEYKNDTFLLDCLIINDEIKEDEY